MLKRAFYLSIIFCFIIVASALTQGTIFLGVTPLSLFNTHTNEQLAIMALNNEGQVYPEALDKISHFLRCPDTGDVKQYDPQLIVLLEKIQAHFGDDKTIEVISGYRTPSYNAMLRSRSEGVARNSLHMQAKAIDIKLTNVDLKDIYEYAKGLKMGGVGFYRDRFVHVDVGPVRFW